VTEGGELTAARVRELLHYFPESGVFTWRQPPGNHLRLRQYTAGGITTGYVVIKIDGRKYKAHRLAWLYTHGDWPSGDLDHINGCPLDNRLCNLRIATNAQNQANSRRDDGKATPKGVKALPGGRFQARITFQGHLRTLGTFDSPESAERAYIAAAREHYGSFARAS
jgi:hypothetical protein